MFEFEDFVVLPDPHQSVHDRKQYRIIRLKNGLTVCLVCENLEPKVHEDHINDYHEDDELGDDEHGEEDDKAHDNAQAETTEDEKEENPGGGHGENADDEHEDDTYDDHDEIEDEQIAAVALSVSIGTLSDPEDCNGLAHFLEHMVFMGSEKYPNEDDFCLFIADAGGDSNAETEYDYTTFEFSCLKSELHSGLDRMAQFFISPLILKDAISREAEAVDSEFQAVRLDNFLRQEQLLQSFAKAGSPAQKFSWGNQVSLTDSFTNDQLYKKLHEFRKRHYSAHRMYLVVQADLKLDELESYVLDTFLHVPSNNLPGDDFKEFADSFDTKEFKNFYYVQPAIDVNQLEMVWFVPTPPDNYKSKPEEYVINLLQHQGKGGLVSHLRNKGWVIGVESMHHLRPRYGFGLISLFHLHLEMSKEGLDHVYEIIEITYSYISMLKNLGPQEKFFEELKFIKNTSFEQDIEKKTPEDFVAILAHNLLFYPPEDVLTGGSLLFEFDPDAIQRLLNSLVPDSMNVTVLTNSAPKELTYKTEKWFGSKYAEKAVPEEWKEKWRKAAPLKEFAMPEPNAFMPEDLQVLDVYKSASLTQYPELVLKTDITELWFLQDQHYESPIAYSSFHLVNPMITDSVKNISLATMYVGMMKMILSECAHAATMAKLAYDVGRRDDGITVDIDGFNQKLPLLQEMITEAIVDFTNRVNENKFRTVKEIVMKEYQNQAMSPTDLAEDLKCSLLWKDHHRIEHRLKATRDLTLEDLKKFSQDFISNLFIKGLIQGNVSKEHAIEVAKKVEETLKCKPIDFSKIQPHQVMQVPTGETWCCVRNHNIEDPNSVITNYYQCGPYSLKNKVIIKLIIQLIKEPLFGALRTRDQLGYKVGCELVNDFQVLGLDIFVEAQTTKHSATYVNSRIEKFVKEATELLAKLKPKEFQRAKDNFIKRNMQVDIDLLEEFERNFEEVLTETYVFDCKDKESEEVKKVKLADVQEWWRQNTPGAGQKTFKKLSIQVVGFKETGDDLAKKKMKECECDPLSLKFVDCGTCGCSTQGEKFVRNIAEFKKQLEIYTVKRRVRYE